MCLLARYFPGIPAEFVNWPASVQDAWIANVPYVLAHQKLNESLLRPETPRGAYFTTLALTDSQADAAAAQLDVIESQVKNGAQ